ncbi:NAD(P)-binding domain-containing protein [Pseudomonas sp.]|uniref:NAD(P)-binding domain-containing protein n=1 Tax=Pseudomonas sp. TaxID=306 RepID=UPI0028AB4EE0|nr:NAD(P)-binding domain-containing protein [Pseudomonas sp.]
MQSLGIIGVGELTESIVRGLRRSGFTGVIMVSPRNTERAQTLAAECACQVLQDNQAVVDCSEIVLLGVQPEHIASVANEVHLKPGQKLISLAAGISLKQLRTAFPQADCVRAMLSCAAKLNHSTVVICPPDAATANLLETLGQLVTLQDEDSFELATVAACMNSWFYFLLHDLEQWLSEKGLPADQARALVLGNIKDCVGSAESNPDKSLQSLGWAIATPGTFSAEGLSVLMHQPVSANWGAACEVVLDALLTRTRPPQ